MVGISLNNALQNSIGIKNAERLNIKEAIAHRPPRTPESSTTTQPRIVNDEIGQLYIKRIRAINLTLKPQKCPDDEITIASFSMEDDVQTLFFGALCKLPITASDKQNATAKEESHKMRPQRMVKIKPKG
ncbi:hypothetical protein ACTXT7_014535 [Hymenolepis weldensis]